MAVIYDLSDTWNDAGTTFKGIGLNVTDTASASGSLLMDLQVGGTSRLAIDKAGKLFFAGSGNSITRTSSALNSLVFAIGGTDRLVLAQSTTELALANGFSYSWGTPGATDLRLFRDAANTLAQRNGTNAQTFNLYNTYTDASNYERGFMKWNSNVLEIGTEAAGTGSGRGLKLGSTAGPTNIIGQNASSQITLGVGTSVVSAVGSLDLRADYATSKITLTSVGTYLKDALIVLSGALPTADPVNAGQLWNDAGTLKISAG